MSKRTKHVIKAVQRVTRTRTVSRPGGGLRTEQQRGIKRRGSRVRRKTAAALGMVRKFSDVRQRQRKQVKALRDIYS